MHKGSQILLIYSNYHITRSVHLSAASQWSIVCKMAWLSEHLNYSLHRITLSMSSSYLSVYHLQVKVYCKESDSNHYSLTWPDHCFHVGHLHWKRWCPCVKIAIWLCEDHQWRFMKVISTNSCFTPFTKFIALETSWYYNI